MKDLSKLLVELLKIESITGNEAALCDYTEKLLRARFAGRTVPAEIRRLGNSIAVLGPHRTGQPSIMFLGHFDTVAGDDTGARVRVEGDNIVGLGASDMKGGLAVMLTLCTQEVFDSTDYNLSFVFYESEEGPYLQNGLHKLLPAVPELKRTDLCFVLEPTNNQLELGCMGTFHALVSVRGKKAHSARPWQGENALYKAIPLLQRLAEYQPRKVEIAGLTFTEVFTPTISRTGDTSRNVVPDLFEINVNGRFSPQTTIEEAKARLEALVKGEADIDYIDSSPAGPVPVGNALLERFQSYANLPTNPKQAYTDVALLALHGIAAVNCGPGIPAQAHQTGEYVPVGNLVRSYELFRGFLLVG